MKPFLTDAPGLNRFNQLSSPLQQALFELNRLLGPLDREEDLHHYTHNVISNYPVQFHELKTEFQFIVIDSNKRG